MNFLKPSLSMVLVIALGIIATILVSVHVWSPTSPETEMVEEAVKAETGVDIKPLEDAVGKQ